jgi:cysteine synthase
MRKKILAALGASLIVASTVQMAAAAEHQHGRKADRASTCQKFRNANDSTAWPSTAESKFLLYHTVN